MNKDAWIALLVTAGLIAVFLLLHAVRIRLFAAGRRTGSGFWGRYAGLYDWFLRKDAPAYEAIIARMRPAVRGKTVLEAATGTGRIAKNLLHDAGHIEAVDAAPQMIAEAKKGCASAALHFSVQDLFHLPYADESFAVVIAANVLHVVPEPEKALAELRRVLTNDGLLIVPTFAHGQMRLRARIKSWCMRRIGFPLHTAWTPSEYCAFLQANGFSVCRSEVFSASFPLVYAECRKSPCANGQNMV